MDGDVVLRPVDDVDHERVALPDLQRRPRVLPVHRDDVVRLAQPLHWRLLDLDDEHKHNHIDQAKKCFTCALKTQVYQACMYSRRATYNELMVVHFGVRREQRKREAREEKEQPGRRQRRHG